MKKLISMLLVISMLCSILPLGATATEVDMTEAEKALSESTYTHISLEANADVDVFASFTSIAEYSRFNKPLNGTAGSHFEKVTYTVNGEEKEVFNYLPLTTSDGTPITGTEDHYIKGFKNKKLFAPEFQTNASKQLVASEVMIAEDLTEENGTKISALRYNISANNSNPKYVFDNNLARTETKYTVKSSHVVEKASAENGNFATILNHGITHKIGPVVGDVYTPNAVYLSTADPTIQVGEKGKLLSILVGTANCSGYNYTAADTAVGAAPKASLNKVTINYADGTKTTKYFIMGKTVNWNDDRKKKNVELSIVYAPKKDSWTAADLYGANKVTAKVLSNANSAEHGIADVTALTSADVIFDNPDILMTENAVVASWNNNRQDTCETDFGNQVNMANIQLEDKEVASFKMQKFFNYLNEKIPTAITVGTSTSQVRQAFIPVTVKGANDEYDYFAWVGATTDYCALLGATVAGYSLEEKVAMLEERMLNVSSETEALEIDAEYADLIANTVVEESDFDANILAKYEIKKLELAGQAAEELRKEKLKERKYNYLNTPNDRDVFVNYEDVANYAKFNTAAAEGSSTDKINEKYTYAEGIELFRYLPHITADGTPVTGREDFYLRGFQNVSTNDARKNLDEKGTIKGAAYAYLTDSYFVPDGTKLKTTKVIAKAANTSKDFYEGIVKLGEETKIVVAPTIVQAIDENGYAIIKNGDVQTKIGPISRTEIKDNSTRLGNSAGVKIENINAKGSTLDVVITSTYINYNGNGYTKSKFATGDSPNAALQELVINYEDGTYDRKKVLVTNTVKSGKNTDTAYTTIVYAPKYNANGEKIVYNERSFYLDSAMNEFTMVDSKNLSTIGLTSIDQINKDTVKFENEDVIYSTVGTVGTLVYNRIDAVSNTLGAYASIASVPLQNKKVESVSFVYNTEAAMNEASAIAVSNEETSTVAPTICLLPLEIEGASEEYVYFAYCGRVANESFLMGATIMDISAQEKIDNAKEAMAKVTINSSIADAKKAKELYELALEEALVDPEKDFDPEKVEAFYELYEQIREVSPLKSDVKLNFFKDEAPKATVKIYNDAEYAGKPYTVVMGYYDAEGVLVDNIIKAGVTTTESVIELAIGKEDYADTTKTVKVFVWNDFATLKPLSDIAVAQETEKKIYMFVGASIVQGDHLTKPTELYYMTRFPYSPADFYNKGRGGSTADSIMKRYDWDIQSQEATHAILTVGTNDIGYSAYKDGDSEITAGKMEKINTAAENIEKLLGMMENDYGKITYMLPPIFDNRDYATTKAKYTGANEAMAKLGEITSAMVAEKGYQYVDNYAFTKAINEKPEVLNSGAVEMYSTDRVHPNAQGGYAIAYNIIQNLFPDSGLVASVDVDASAGTVNAENATVENLAISENGVSYTYNPKALPWTANDAYNKADGRYVDLTDDLNREIIKVTGLEDGTYTLKMDGMTVGTYTNAQLAEGINIAIEANNPGQIQSKEVDKVNELKHEYIAKMRGYALAKEGLINAGAIDRVTGEISNKTKYDATIKKAVSDKVYCYQYYADYEIYDKQYPTWVEESENLTEEMRKAAIPAVHTVEITK